MKLLNNNKSVDVANPKNGIFTRAMTVETGLKPVSTDDDKKTKYCVDDTTQQPKFRGKYRIASARLKNYDYSQNGAYFITICIKNREHFFGKIVNGKLQETKQAEICMRCWLDLPSHYANCILDEFVIMPNHTHGIIIIQNREVQINNGHDNAMIVETGLKSVSTDTKRHSISEIIRGFKTFTARKINDLQNTQGTPFWQTRFYDRIIRNENELNRIREYIFNNPINWKKDRNNPKNIYM